MSNEQKTIEQSLVQRLKSRLTPAEISQMAEIIATLSAKGIEIDDVFPYGISQPLDAISIRGNLTAEQLSVLGGLIPELGALKDYRVFPRGIIAPERYRLHINVNR